MRDRVDLAVVTAALLCVCSVGSAAAECIYYGDFVHWAGSVDTPYDARGVAVSGTHAYVADRIPGLTILPAQCDPTTGVGEEHVVASTMRLRAYPNPGSCQTFIRFETAKDGLVQTSIYDVAGRRVRELSGGLKVPDNRAFE